MTKKQMKLVVVIIFGIFGVHKFIDKDIKMGLIYLFTGGLFGIGWIIDIIKSLTDVFEEKQKDNSSKNRKELPTITEEQKPSVFSVKQEDNIIYDKKINVSYSHTEGRQKLIKQLIKDDEFLKGQEFFNDDMIICDTDLEEGEMPSEKQCINVNVLRDGNKYPDHLGYITDDDEKELKDNIGKAAAYKCDLYVSTTEDGKYSLKVRVRMYKSIE